MITKCQSTVSAVSFLLFAYRDDVDSVFRCDSQEGSNYCASMPRDNIPVRQSQQRYSTAELYKPQTIRRRSPSTSVSIESHEWYDRCGMLR